MLPPGNSYTSLTFGCFTIPHDSRRFCMSDDGIGLGGLGFAISQSIRWGIQDQLFLKTVSQFRREPQVPLGLEFARLPGDIALLSTLIGQWKGNQLAGAPPSHLIDLGTPAAVERLCALLPSYWLPACDAVCVDDFIVVLEEIAAGRLSLPERRPDVVQTARLAPIGAPRPVGSGRVTPEHVEQFAEYYDLLEPALRSAIPWDLQGWRAYAPADTANAIASDMLGIPVDLRVGALACAAEVAEATRLAAGHVYSVKGEKEASRLGGFVSGLVPRVHHRAVGPRRVIEGTLGAAWSVVLDEVLNSPTAWSRNADGELPRVGRERPVKSQLQYRANGTRTLH